MLKRIMSLALVLVLVLSLMAACSPKAPVEDGGDEGGQEQVGSNEEIKIALASDIKSLDPQGHNDTTSEKVSFLVFNRLYRLDENFQAVPDLAESVEQPSEKEWVIKIKEGVLFHDGEEIKSSDVKYSLERSQESAQVKHVLEQMESVEIVDDYTVKVNTKDIFAPFINTLVHAGVSIIPEGFDDWDKPIGSGPYKFSEWVSGDKIVLERNDDYYDEERKGIADKIVFRVIPEGSSRTIALETGEVDVNADLNPIDAGKVEDHENLTLYDTASTSIEYLGMNVDMAPFDNKLVRQAMNYAIDKQTVVDIALGGQANVASSYTWDGLLGHVEGSYTYDPEKAKELLKEAGYEDGLSFEIWSYGEDAQKRIAEVVSANLAEIGVETTIEMFKWDAYLDATNSGNQPMFVLSWASNPDIDATLTPLVSTGSIGGQNRSRYSNPKVDDLIVEARAELDVEARTALYNEIFETLNEDAPWVPLFNSNKLVGAQKDLKGVVLNAQSIIDLEGLHY